jgi:predicted nucleotidyltransferase
VAAKLSRELIALKRYFYAPRPALTLRFLRLQGGRRPPRHLQVLVDGTDLPAATVRVIGRLVAAKSLMREMGGRRRQAVRPPTWKPRTGCSAALFADDGHKPVSLRDMIGLAPPWPGPL